MNNFRNNKWNNKTQATKEKPHGVARVISKRGFCSRSQAENLVREGRVSLRGKIVRDPDTPAYENDKILVDGKAVTANAFVYFMMNKPRGYVTTANDEKGRATVMDLFRERFCNMFPGKPVPHISPVGRLDAASEGLLLFTNDTKWADALLQTRERAKPYRRETRESRNPNVILSEASAKSKDPVTALHTKIYRVQVAGHPTAEDLHKMEEGFNVRHASLAKKKNSCTPCAPFSTAKAIKRVGSKLLWTKAKTAKSAACSPTLVMKFYASFV